MRGAAMKVVQELLRHATIEMTMRYAHLSPDVPRHAVKLLDGLGSSAAPAPNAGRQVGDKGRFGTQLLGTLGEGAGYRTCPANDQKTKCRADLHRHHGDLALSRRGRTGRLGTAITFIVGQIAGALPPRISCIEGLRRE